MTSDRPPSRHEGSEQLAPGDVLARKYRLLSILGEGGMAVVWVAHNIALDTKVAVKVLRSSLSNDPKFVSRVQKEAKATAAIAHKNIVQVFDYGVTGTGAPYIVMELLQGETLAQRLQQRGKLRPAEAVRILLRAMKGITVAHAKGIVHRDLKPENIFLAIEDNGTERPKVLDFGVASVMRDASDDRSRSTGMVGTPAYIPPEAIQHDKRGDTRGDVWALGVMLYEMITGVLPFHGKTAHALLKAIVEEPHEPMSALARGVDAKLEAIAAKALAKSPDDRYQGSRELFDELNRWLGELEGGVSVPRISASPALALPSDPHSDEEGPTAVGPALDATGTVRAHSPLTTSPPTASSRPTMRAASRASGPNQTTQLVVFALGLFALGAGAFLFTRPPRAPAEPERATIVAPPPAAALPTAAPPAENVPLDISSLPEGAQVFVDDARVEIPHMLRRGSTVHVRVEAPGFVTWTQEIAAEGAIRLTYVGTAKPASLPPRAWHPTKPAGDYKDVPYLIRAPTRA